MSRRLCQSQRSYPLVYDHYKLLNCTLPDGLFLIPTEEHSHIELVTEAGKEYRYRKILLQPFERFTAVKKERNDLIEHELA